VLVGNGRTLYKTQSHSCAKLDRTPKLERKMVRVPTNRVPTHPGEMLLEEFLKPMGLSQRDLAGSVHVPYQRINEIVNGRRGVTPSTALRLAKYFGTSAGFWMNLQLRWDLYYAQKSEAGSLETIKPYKIVSGGSVAT
jgi:antitoxin HigA-1